MLNNRERHEWAGIERQLTADRGFNRKVSHLLKRELRGVSFWRRFYPGAYLGAALTYMLMAMGGGLRILGGLLLFSLVVWVVVELLQVMAEKSRTRSRLRLKAR
jgi:hypothetical protein